MRSKRQSWWSHAKIFLQLGELLEVQKQCTDNVIFFPDFPKKAKNVIFFSSRRCVQKYVNVISVLLYALQPPSCSAGGKATCI